jgi:hypothetical protein
MKKIVLAALGVLSLGAGIAQAQSYSYGRPEHLGSYNQNSGNPNSGVGQHSQMAGGG